MIISGKFPTLTRIKKDDEVSVTPTSKTDEEGYTVVCRKRKERTSPGPLSVTKKTNSDKDNNIQIFYRKMGLKGIYEPETH